MKKVGLAPGLASSRLSLSQFEETYLQYSHTNKARSTYETDERAFRIFRRFIGNPSLAKITQQTVEGFKTFCSQTMQSSTVNVLLRHLKAAFSMAVQWERTETNPFKRSRLLRVAPKRPNYLSKQQVQVLLATIGDPIFKDIIHFMLLTGLRRQEALNLRWRDIDLQRNSIHVLGKGLRLRNVSLNPAALEIVTQTQRKTDYIFGNPKTGKPRYNPRFGRRFRQYANKAGLPECTLHTLRHTFASHLIMAGADLPSVQRLLGHSSITTTMIYSHLADEHLEKTVRMVTYT